MTVRATEAIQAFAAPAADRRQTRETAAGMTGFGNAFTSEARPGTPVDFPGSLVTMAGKADAGIPFHAPMNRELQDRQ